MNSNSKRLTIFPGSDGLHKRRGDVFRQFREHVESKATTQEDTTSQTSPTSHLADISKEQWEKSRTLQTSPTTSEFHHRYLQNNDSLFSRRNRVATWKSEDPWTLYEKLYHLELGGSVVVVHKKEDVKEQFTIRSVAMLPSQAKIVSQLSHQNLLQTLDMFEFDKSFYIVSEHMAVSLNHFIACESSPSEPQIAAIAKQCLSAMQFLESHQLLHTEFVCRNVVISMEGIVKISKLDQCQKIDGKYSGKENSLALGQILLKIMKKESYSQDPETFNLDGWSKTMLEFLSESQNQSVDSLLLDPFLSNVKVEALKWFIAYALRKTRSLVHDVK